MMLRESHNKVHHDLLKGESAFFCGDTVKRYPFLMGQNFVLLADCILLRNPLSIGTSPSRVEFRLLFGLFHLVRDVPPWGGRG